jgi:hypothetical protein
VTAIGGLAVILFPAPMANHSCFPK